MLESLARELIILGVMIVLATGLIVGFAVGLGMWLWLS